MARNERISDHADTTTPQGSSCQGSDCCGGDLPRRQFLKVAGLGAASVASSGVASQAVAGPFTKTKASDHFVPADKRLDREWVKALHAKGEPTYYSGVDLATIGMPVGGICTGQLYLTGDGRLAHWDIFNQFVNTGTGRTSYDLDRVPASTLAQGFAVKIGRGPDSVVRSLDIEGFPKLRFLGEYPIGRVEYRDPSLPVEITLDAFSPFIPLNEEESALPATVMQFQLKNTSKKPVDIELAGWLENGVCRHTAETTHGTHVNRVLRSPRLTMVASSARPAKATQEAREPIVLADFEGADYGDWTTEGTAFGVKPAAGSAPGQQPVSGFQGEGLANSFLGDRDKQQGKLTSPSFTIDRAFINLLIGGGAHKGKTCVNLLVDDQVVLTATGKNSERLAWCNWNVRRWAGQQARIEIVDQYSDGWGHINVDQIELSDSAQSAATGPLKDQYDFGTMGLAILGEGEETLATAQLAGVENPPSDLFDQASDEQGATRAFGEPQLGAVGKSLTLQPGETRELTFLVAWHFPLRPDNGNFYASRFRDAVAVAEYLATHLDRLAAETRLWHRTWYDSSLPHWLLDRLFSTTSTLATSTCQWWANGRFWAWEGVGCCRGTCTHVWNYEHSMARLFPRLERSVREMQDLHPDAGFDEKTGMIRFRGENWARWAGDGQAGTVLKAYREHLISSDDTFLKTNWPRIRKTLEFLIREDAYGDGLLEGEQHNTYDIDFFGANAMIGSLYLAALLAGREMAREMNDAKFAKQCTTLAERGGRLSVERLFNGEFFIQDVDLDEHPKFQTGDGCLADQLFGQGWAHQVGLGYVYPEEVVKATLQSIWKYNWTPDIGPQNEAHAPNRWFARPGEAGLFTCTWPLGEYLEEGVRYKNEIWTGIEYQVAGHMAWDGMVTEALAICRGIHDRYHPATHNPWNEVECGDHYARGMASHGVFLGLCGFHYDGPNGLLGFSPRITPENFRAAFTAAEGWGTLAQVRSGGRQTQSIELNWGRLTLSTLQFDLEEGVTAKIVQVRHGDTTVKAEFKQQGSQVTVSLVEPITLNAPDTLEVEIA